MASENRSSPYEGFDAHLRNYLATHEKAHLLAAFRLLDLDRDGFVSKAEMIAFLRGYGADREEARERMLELFRAGDRNKDGVMDEREFAGVAKKLVTTQGPRVQKLTVSQRDEEVQRLLALYSETNDSSVLEEVFKLLDQDHSGSLSQAELQASILLKDATDKATAANILLTLGDLNGDGVLNMDEFVSLMHK